jgi:hypothetical protein
VNARRDSPTSGTPTTRASAASIAIVVPPPSSSVRDTRVAVIGRSGLGSPAPSAKPSLHLPLQVTVSPGRGKGLATLHPLLSAIQVTSSPARAVKARQDIPAPSNRSEAHAKRVTALI